VRENRAPPTNAAQLTKRRMLHTGVGCDVVCLPQPPLHAVPLLIYRRDGVNYDGNITPQVEHFFVRFFNF
jgi:hypothetical protein